MSSLPQVPDEERTRAVIVELGATGPFKLTEAADALTAAGIETDPPSVLATLEGRQAIVRLGGEPARWELVID